MKHRTLIALLLLSNITIAQSVKIPGFANKIKGEDLSYHSPQPDASKALLVRSEASDNYIEWQTDCVPENFDGDFVDFELMMAIDVNTDDPQSWDMHVNDEKLFSINSPKDTTKHILIEGKHNSRFDFNAQRVDKYGDLVGYVSISVPKSILQNGEPANIKVIGKSAESRTWFIIYQYKMIPSFSIQPENAIRNGENGPERVVKLEIVNYKNDAFADIKLGDFKKSQKLDYGYNRLFLTFVADTSVKILPYELTINNKLFDEGDITLRPIQEMTIYLLHHSHVDIGYTHVQKEVEEKHWDYIEQCIELAEESAEYPDYAHFKWNIEVMWALDSYWENADNSQKERLKKAIQNGWIELDAFYGNLLTGLCTSQELNHSITSAKKIADECGVTLNSAMISDIPGWTWGMIPVLGKNGVEYLSLGTNTFHRIGYTIEQWGDKPFYWKSASGNEKVLTWIHGRGYSDFHTGLGNENIVNKLEEEILLSYMNELQDNEYPFDIAILRYNIGSDNGPPDRKLSEKVINWNQNYISPKLVISTTSEAFSKFEDAYGKKLPVIEGDFTGYWEDGAASSANETAQNRKNAYNLSQVQTLMAMLNTGFPEKVMDKAWQKVMLYNEHTWGSWNSISEPHSDFTKQQWAVKKAFVADGEIIADSLKQVLLSGISENQSEYIEVINTHSWVVNDVVKLSPEQSGGYNSVKDISGKKLPAQILKDGSLVFISGDIQPFSSKKYKLVKGKKKNIKITGSEQNVIDNGNIRLLINEKSGVVDEFFIKNFDDNIVNNELFSGLNEYIYITGQHPENRQNAINPNVEIDECGQVFTSVKVDYSEIPGCNSLTSTYIIYNEWDRIDIVNTLVKKEIFTKEGVHFAFPFNLPDGVLRYDLAYGVGNPLENHIEGSNFNFFTIENWVDISNSDFGITWVSNDAPLIQISDITNDPIAVGYLTELEPSQTIISYVMNNYWETNYLAAQGGKSVFRYSIFPHTGYNSAFAEKKSLEVQEPLIAVSTGKKTESINLGNIIDSENLIIQWILPTIVEGEYKVSVYNPGNKTETLKWDKKVSDVSLIENSCKVKIETTNIDSQDYKLFFIKLAD